MSDQSAWVPEAWAPKKWVPAAPFRRYVVHLMEAAAVPWRVVAHQAGVPASTLHTLVYGRGGRPRPRLERDAAELILGVSVRDLTALRGQLVDSRLTRHRIAQLRAAGAEWEEVAHYLGLSQPQCQGLANAETRFCTAWVDALARAACEAHGVGAMKCRQRVPLGSPARGQGPRRRTSSGAGRRPGELAA